MNFVIISQSDIFPNKIFLPATCAHFGTYHCFRLWILPKIYLNACCNKNWHEKCTFPFHFNPTNWGFLFLPVSAGLNQFLPVSTSFYITDQSVHVWRSRDSTFPLNIKDIIWSYENYDNARAMSSSCADPVLGHCPDWGYLNI